MIWSVDSEHFGLLTFNRGLNEYFLSQRGIHLETGMRPEDLFPQGEFVQRWHMFYRRALDEGSLTIEYPVFAGTRTLRLNARTRTIWTAITSSPRSPARGRRRATRSSIFGESTVGAVRIDDYKYRFIDQPDGWLGPEAHPDVPYITNLRLDPFERTGWPNNGTKDGAQQYFDWFKFQFWRFVFVQHN